MLLRMRLEALYSRMGRGPRKSRILSTACWHFPVYSHTFVYRELCALARHGFNVRFAYCEIASRRRLASECAPLWRYKRRLVLTSVRSQKDLAYYRRRMPERVGEITKLLAAAAGLTTAEITAHPHFRDAFSFARMAECWEADYIHTYFFYEGTIFGFVASRLLGIPRGVSCYADHMLSDYALKAVRLHLVTSDVIVATSERIRSELEAFAGGPLPESFVKPNAVDMQYAPARKRSAQASGQVLRIAAVSRIHSKKGLIYLIEAAAALRARHVPVVIEVLGSPDDDDPGGAACFAELTERIADLGLGSVVKMEGWKTSNEVRQCLAASDIFVAPYIELPNGDKDGIPTALLEAMAGGCAVVATSAGSICEVIDEAVEGLIVPQCDSIALADAIQRLACDPPLRARLASAARDRILRQFDVSTCETVFHTRVHEAITARASDRR